MLKIACHDAASGEKPINLISWLMIPFARTQSKTIKEQYEAGCRSFDIRIRQYKGEWHCAHGLFVTKRTAFDILTEIASFDERCQVCITYEGRNNDEFIEYAHKIKSVLPKIIWGGIALKYGKDSKGVNVKYQYLERAEPCYEGGIQGFLPLDGRTWHIYLPIPWLWDRLYKRPHVFNEETYTYVDFL